MELFPYQAVNVASVMTLGLLYDTDVPVNGERGIHSTFNDAIAFRVFQKTPVNTPTVPFRWQYQPIVASTFQSTGFLPAWIEVDSTLGYGPSLGADITTRIVPKVRLPALDARFASTVNYYNESVAIAILAHKMINHGSQFSINSGNNYLSPQYSLTEAGNWLVAEYDFGAEVEIAGLAGISVGSTVAALMVLGTNGTWLQAYVDGQWVDYVDTYANLRTTTNYTPVVYKPQSKIKAQKFRLVNKAATWPWSTTGHYTFGLQFYGKYTGTKPRTLGKYKHMSLFTLQPSASYANSTAWQFNWPAIASTVAGRYFAQTHVTITDDLKLAGSNDIYMADTTYNTVFGEPPVPSFRIKQDALVGRGV